MNPNFTLASVPSLVEGAEVSAELLLDKSDAALAGARVVQALRAGTVAVIDACEETFRSIESFNGDREFVDAFLRELERGRIISSSEARLGLDSSKLSMLRTVGRHADFFRRDELFSYITETGSGGYTQLYSIAVAYKRIPGTAEEKYQTLIARLWKERPQSRQELGAFARSVKQKSASSALLGAGENASAHQIDLIAADVTSAGRLRELRVIYADVKPPIFRIAERLCDDAIAVIATPLVELSLVERQLLSQWNMPHILGVFLAEPPLNPNVRDAQAMLIAARENRPCAFLDNMSWPTDEQAVNLLSLAEQVAPCAKHRLHVLASAKSEGWAAWTSHEDNWSLSND